MLELKRNETFRAWLSRKDRQAELQRLNQLERTDYIQRNSRSDAETAAKYQEWCRRKDAHLQQAAREQQSRETENSIKLANEKAERTQRGQELYARHL